MDVLKKLSKKLKNQVEDIADDLIKLYAERSQLEGFAFSKDDEDQVAFDEAFPYVETEDQLRSIDEIKKDMQASQPMDRLLVGDVGLVRLRWPCELLLRLSTIINRLLF